MRTKSRSNRAVVERPIDELKPHDRNSRTHSTRQIGQIAKNIKRFGFVNPVLLDSEDNTLAGHGRLAAAKALGIESLPTLDIGSMSDADHRAYIVADSCLLIHIDGERFRAATGSRLARFRISHRSQRRRSSF